MKIDVVKCLSCLPEFQDLGVNLEDAITEGFIEGSGQDYKFVHDSVRESAFNLIPANERNQFHYHLGMSIYNSMRKKDITDDLVFIIPDQINHGNHNLIPPPQRMHVVELNYNAGKKSMSSSNFAAARSYLAAAIRLLPDGHWKSHYDLSKHLFLILGNAALAAGYTAEASDSVNALIDNGCCLGEIF